MAPLLHIPLDFKSLTSIIGRCQKCPVVMGCSAIQTNLPMFVRPCIIEFDRIRFLGDHHVKTSATDAAFTPHFIFHVSTVDDRVPGFFITEAPPSRVL